MKKNLLIFFASNFFCFAGSAQASLFNSVSLQKPVQERNLSALELSDSYRLVEKVLFSLGEKAITLSDRNQLERELRLQLVPFSLLLRIFPKKTLLSNKTALLDFVIAQRIIDLSLDENNFLPGKKDIQARLQQLKKSSSTSFKKRLQQSSLTLKELEKKISQALKRNFFVNKEFISKIVISDSDINGYFFNTKGGNLFQAFEYEFSFLAFKQTSEGLEKARQTFHAFTSSFGALPEKVEGGRFEKHRLKSGEMSLLMEKVLKSLSVSQISPLTSIGNQVYIFKLDWKSPVFTVKQEKERRRIYALLLEKELAATFREWLKEKKSQYSLSHL